MKLINRKQQDNLAWLWQETRSALKENPDFHPEAYGRGVEDALVYIASLVTTGRIRIQKRS